MSTRKEIIDQALRRLGSYTGSIVSGSATTAVLGGMYYAMGDDDGLAGDSLFMLDASAEADKVRTVSEWDDSAAEAKWVTASGTTNPATNSFIVLPGAEFSLAELRAFLNDRLQQTRFSVETMLPTTRYERYYSLGKFTWIRNRRDVLGVFLRSSENLVDNGKFETWLDGASAAPQGWTLAGSGGTVARSTSNVQSGYYSAQLTRAGTNVTLTHSVGLLGLELQSESVTAECYVDSHAASSATISISDGTTTTASTANSGTGLEKLTVTATLAATATACDIILTGTTNDGATQFSNVKASRNAIPENMDRAGSTAQRLRPLPHEVRDIGGVPVVELRNTRGLGSQIVVYSKAPFPTLSADTDSTDCPDDVIVPGLVYELARRMRKGQDRERFDRLMQQAGREYGRTAAALLQAPVPASQAQAVIRSA